MTLPSITASQIAQRSLQKTSGPFDKELTDVTSALVTSEASDFLAMTTDETAAPTISQADLYNLISTEGERILEGTNELNEVFDLDLDVNSAFLEEFVNLGDILLRDEVAMETAPSDSAPQEIPTISIVEAPVVNKKRPAPVDEDLDTSFSSVHSDHSGYVAKTKRARHCSSVSLISDTESEVGSTTGMSKEDKYAQRRQKNNIASRRSRETRKQKFVSMDQQASDLEKSNAELRNKVTELEMLAKEMKEILIQRMVAK